MPALPNPRHERFAQELAAGKSACDAYVTAGFRPGRPNASRLQHDDNIVYRVAEILADRERMAAKAEARAIEKAAVDKVWVMTCLRMNVERALQAVQATDEEGNPIGEFRYEGAVANRALELLGKEIGMFIDRKHITRSSSFAEMDFDQLLAIAQGRAPAPQIEHQEIEATDVTEVDDQ